MGATEPGVSQPITLPDDMYVATAAEAAPSTEVLKALGLDTLSVTVYLAMIRQPAATVSDLASAVGVERAQVLLALTNLAELELLAVDAGDAIRMAPPHRAIDGLIARRERELAAAAGRLQQSRESVSLMLESYVRQHQEPVADGLALVEGSEPVRGLLRALAGTTVATVVNLMPRAPVADHIEAAAASDAVAIARGLDIRSVMPAAIARDSRALAAARASVELGVNIRLHAAPPMQCIIFDGTTAIVPRDPSAVSDGAWVVQNPGLLHPIKLLAEAVWAQAVPIAASEADGEEARVREVFRLLGQGQKDETIARRLETSVRTVRRLVALGMEILGTDSRFEAGVMAQRRGWLTDH